MVGRKPKCLAEVLPKHREVPGCLTRVAMLQVLTLDGRLEATARMVGRESLPTAGPHVAPSTPALHWSGSDRNNSKGV